MLTSQFVFQSPNSRNTSYDTSSTEENVEIAINVGQEDESYTKSNLGDGKPTLNQKEQNVLDLRWNAETNCFVFDLMDLVENARKCMATKRSIISIVSSI